MSLSTKRPSTFLLSTLVISGSGLISSALAQGITVNSPDNRIQATIIPSINGPLSYSVKFKGQAVVLPSALGITVDGQNLGQGATLGRATTRVFDETYKTIGKHTTARNYFRETDLPVTGGAAQTAWQLEVRVFDDGVAMRYRVPGTGRRQINGEASSWQLPKGSVVWYQTDTSTYERPFLEQPSDLIPANTTVASPLAAKLPNGLGYAFLSEANLVNYSDMALRVMEPGKLNATFDKNSEGWTNEGEIVTPWRVTLLANDLNGLVNSDILPNLCPPPTPELANATWIKPGRSNWHWMVTGRPRFESQRQWVDWTKQLGFEYYLIDDGWRDWKVEGKGQWPLIKEVVDYAKTQNVGIWAWVNSREVRTTEQRADYFQKAKDAGVVGLKIDFPERPNTEWVNWYDETLQDLAKFQLMVDFHGAVKPSGRERTWPQELTREAIFGRESGKLPASHDTALPFTRYVQGHADFTPTDFRTDRLDGSSWAHELAQGIVYTSPFLCYGGSPANYLGNPGRDVLEAIPPTWDETLVLPDSEIGRTAAFARRKGNDWFIGVVNGDEARPFTIDLKFLGEGSYRVDSMTDLLSDNAGWNRTQSTLSRKSTLSFDLRRNGGFVARVSKIVP